jgi:two-component system NtrC family sensor kinase
MFLEFILLIILCNVLRKQLQTKTLFPQWDRLFFIAMLFSIAMLALEIVFGNKSRIFTIWIAEAMLFAIIYLALNKKEFKPARGVVWALLPLIVVSFISNVVGIIDSKFHSKWNNYFEVANLFAIIWMIAMLIMNNKQRKALEKERLKTLEIQKEIEISERIQAGLESQVTERTAALTKQKEELEFTLDELKETQTQLIHSEKMASLGELTAGIAHEIQNPLNFVNNFSEVNAELIDELKAELATGNMQQAIEIANDIAENEKKINHHGKRAEAIVKGMLQHSRSSTGVKEPTDINALADEYLRLAYHGLRAKDKSFNAAMKTDYDETIGMANVIPQDMGRVILNLITNAFYVVAEKKHTAGAEYHPTVSVSTKKIGNKIEIRVTDNGNGMPQKVLDKIFQPFFTTKPSGQGTGLGLSMSYDIVTKGHAGELKVETKEGEYATFIISIPQ